MNARLVRLCGLLLAFGLPTATLAQELNAIDPTLPAAETAPAPSEPAKGVLDGRFYVAPMFSYLLADKDRRTDDGLGGTFSVGKGIADNAAFELTGYYLQADGKNDGGTAKLYGGGASFLVFPRNSFPNAYGIVTATYNQAKDHPGADSKYSGPGFEAGIGYLLPLGLWNGWALRVEAKFRLDDHRDKNTGAGGKNEFYDGLFNAGLYIPIGAPPAEPAPAPVPVVVVPVIVPADSDGDGVPDTLDRCPGTPQGTKVDSVGCPLKPPCQVPEPGQRMDLSGCGTGDVVVLRGVTFEFDKSRLTPNAKTILDTVVDALQVATLIHVEIGGHTDSKGSDEYNLKLSDRRAAAVRTYLIEHGIDAARLTSHGYGEAQPVADNDTDAGRELNRRVELKIQ